MLMFFVVILSVVSAVRLATRNVIRNGAMTCLSQWCHQTTMTQDRSTSENETNLGLGEERKEEVCNGILGTPRSNVNEKVDSVKGRRLDEYGDDRRLQSVRSGKRSHGISETLAMQSKPYNDHEREDGIE